MGKVRCAPRAQPAIVLPAQPCPIARFAPPEVKLVVSERRCPFRDRFRQEAEVCCAAKKPEVSSTTRPCLSQTGTGWYLTPLVFACGGQDQFAYIPRPSVRGRGAQRPMSTHKHKMQSPLTFRGLGAPRIKLRTLIPSYTGRYIYRG